MRKAVRPLGDRGFARSSGRDERGNVAEELYFAVDDGPCGAAFPAGGRVRQAETASRRFFGAADEPVLCDGGYASRAMAYDEQGNRTEDRYFGTDGKPTLHRDGYARVAARYDERGNGSRRPSSMRATHRPSTPRASLARPRNTTAGARNEVAYFGPEDKPAVHQDGCARQQRYDERRTPRRDDRRGTDGQPAFRREGYAIERRTYDEQGNPAKRPISTPPNARPSRPAASPESERRGTRPETTSRRPGSGSMGRTTTRKDARRPTGSSTIVDW